MDRHLYRFLFRIEPCHKAQEWLQTQSSMVDAWANCTRGDWMWWLLHNVHSYKLKKSTSYYFVRSCLERALERADRFNGEIEMASIAFEVSKALTAIYNLTDFSGISYWSYYAARWVSGSEKDTNELCAQAEYIRSLINPEDIECLDWQILNNKIYIASDIEIDEIVIDGWKAYDVH
jgi:hypothetical protein